MSVEPDIGACNILLFLLQHPELSLQNEPIETEELLAAHAVGRQEL